MIDHRIERRGGGAPANASTLGLTTAGRPASPTGDRVGRLGLPDALAYWEQGAGTSQRVPEDVARKKRRSSLVDRLRSLRSSDPRVRVGRRLARLSRRGSRWHSLTEIPVGFDGAHIDHLVIGPGGIFTVDARSHPRSRMSVRGNVFRVDGVAYPYISASRHEALRAARCLSAACGFPVEVAGLVVVTGAEEISVEGQPDGVHVLADTSLQAWLRRRDQRIDGPTLSAVYDAARRSTTWNLHSS